MARERRTSFGLDGVQSCALCRKTDLATDRKGLASGRFTWNYSSMSCFAAGPMLAALRDDTDEILSAMEQTFAATRLDKDIVVLDALLSSWCPIF